MKPIGECPCFVGSMPFISSISGYEVRDWIIQRCGRDLYCTKFSRIWKVIPLRPQIAVPFVITWKELSGKKNRPHVLN